jgi:hypothetical protein
VTTSLLLTIERLLMAGALTLLGILFVFFLRRDSRR